MKCVLTGGTGFIGTRLIPALSRYMDEIVVLTRSGSLRPSSSSVRFVSWDASSKGSWMDELDGADVVINCAGKNLFEERWTDRVKREIADSRIRSTEVLVEAIGRAVRRPHLLISVSAIGVYGDPGPSMVTEESPAGSDFLARLVSKWEEAARGAEQYGVRVSLPRLGIVLERSGGIVQRLMLPFTLFAGGWIGSGDQFVSWVHMDDVVRGILFPLTNTRLGGPFNVTAPQPVTMKEFCRRFGGVLSRPSWIPVPRFALSMLYGDGASVLVAGQRVAPQRLQREGFEFSYPDLTTALRNIVAYR